MGQSIWLAFSANIWNTKLKQQNKANAQAMVEVKLGQTKAPAFKPDEASLSRQLLECTVLNYPVPMCLGPDSSGQEQPNPAPAFPFNSLAWNNGSRHMAQTCKRLPLHTAKPWATNWPWCCLTPWAYAAELNALRLLAHQQGCNSSPKTSTRCRATLRSKVWPTTWRTCAASTTCPAVVSRASFEALQNPAPTHERRHLGALAAQTSVPAPTNWADFGHPRLGKAG